MELSQVILRSLQFLWTLLITALIGNVIDDAFSGNPSSINYAMFVAVFSWVVLLYGLVAAFMEAFNIPIVSMILDGLAAIFTLIAGIVLAAKLGAHSCSNLNYTTHNSLTDGAHNYQERCRELQASCAFFWFLFATYVASAVFSFMNRGSGSTVRRGGIRKGGPVMTQV